MIQESDPIVESFLHDISRLTETEWLGINAEAAKAKKSLARADKVMLSTSLQDSKRFLYTSSAEKIALRLETHSAVNKRIDAVFERLAATSEDKRFSEDVRGRLRALVQHVLRLLWSLPTVALDEKSQQAGRDELRPFAGYLSFDLIPPYLRD
jgi:hypothetical protein